MTNLTRASNELCSGSPDECFDSLESLGEHCENQRENSRDLSSPPREMFRIPDGGLVMLEVRNEDAFLMNNRSFTQLCGLARVNSATTRCRPCVLKSPTFIATSSPTRQAE